MDIMKAADNLRKLLVACEFAAQQITALEDWISKRKQQENQQTLASNMNGNQSWNVHTTFSLSVYGGLHQVYKTYHTMKWQQVQKTAQLISSHLTADETGTSLQQTSSPPPGVSTRPDMTTDWWMGTLCKLHRDD